MDKNEQWKQLDDFSFYKEWKTPSGFLCGTYASSVLLAYWQDHLDPSILPMRIRNTNSQLTERYIETIKKSVQPIDFPSTPAQVAIGLNHFFRKHECPYRARSTALGSWTRVTKRILAGEPVMVGVLKMLGSTYGNHWVVVHGFLETASGERFYKIHDNWGQTEKIIPASWANGTLSLRKVKDTGNRKNMLN